MLKKIIIIFSLFLITSCSSTSSNQIDRRDTNRVLNVDLGVVTDVEPVNIKGETSKIGSSD